MAFPGTSNHGLGLAIDIFPENVQAWVRKNGTKYGWSWHEGRAAKEFWHFTYDPTKTTIYTTDWDGNLLP
jgi:LAS superfamily LD-carboxypeptidase LdcB